MWDGFLGTCSQSLNLTQLVSDQPRFPEVSDCCKVLGEYWFLIREVYHWIKIINSIPLKNLIN